MGRVLQRCTRPKAVLEPAETAGVRYGVLRAPADREGQPNWERIEGLSGRMPVLLPDGVTAPPHSSLRVLTCPGYEKELLLATACELMRRTRMPMYRRVVGLIDPDGACADYLHPLLHHCTSVRVVTGNLPVYEDAAYRMMEQLGAPVLAGNSLSILSECVLILIPGVGPGDGDFPCPVLAGSRFVPSRPCDLISGLQVAPPPDITARCPRGIAPHRFAAALYEDGGVDAGGFVATSVLYNYRTVPLGTAVQAVTEKAQAGIRL